MTASSHLLRHWRTASRAQIASTLDNAHTSVAAFADATAAQGSLIQSWVAGQEVIEYDHYPSDDVVDVRHGSQFYYHAHRDGDQEHGHLHLFWHATASGRRRYFQPEKPRWNRTEPTHLFAISLDARGLPVALFTVNQWVTDGHWLDATTTLACVDRFVMESVDGHETSCRWLTGFVRLYRPLVKELLIQRDQRMARRSDMTKALRDHRLEVLSSIPIDWMADMDALQTEAARRKL
ncbi:MAG: hypothetical protein GW928_03000 [Rhodoferax sp.]|nr:hypothetical protein [Rhodoferax sp.]PIZ22914.1 MAG: hypothetical protein COY49_05975 [Comamonadaceae bacterium CG_4_10_14_0_8_um_filter_57_29]PJC14998.1 MAG: hypothetical protein CO065_12925 [Comamonadaceae bacterium CG_4_9_14_0_8_um_filter_57_21]